MDCSDQITLAYHLYSYTVYYEDEINTSNTPRRVIPSSIAITTRTTISCWRITSGWWTSVTTTSVWWWGIITTIITRWPGSASVKWWPWSPSRWAPRKWSTPGCKTSREWSPSWRSSRKRSSPQSWCPRSWPSPWSGKWTRSTSEFFRSPWSRSWSWCKRPTRCSTSPSWSYWPWSWPWVGFLLPERRSGPWPALGIWSFLWRSRVWFLLSWWQWGPRSVKYKM